MFYLCYNIIKNRENKIQGGNKNDNKIRGNIVNEFGETVGKYNINGINDYFVSLYGVRKGYMTEKQLLKLCDDLELYIS